MLQVICPDCGRGYGVDASHFGRSLRCHCGTLLGVVTPGQGDVPAADTEAAPPRLERTQRRHRAGAAGSQDGSATRRKPFAVAAVLSLLPALGLAFAPWLGEGETSFGPATLARDLARTGGRIPGRAEDPVLMAVAGVGSFGYLLAMAVAFVGALVALDRWRSGLLTGGFLAGAACWTLWLVLFALLGRGGAAAPGIAPLYWAAGAASGLGFLFAFLAQAETGPPRRSR